ncbi:GAF domain-containing sensor histidine kinase [Rhodohalobacter sp.]|uniref:GAF domain-containing sensor histidine kinase n=1 Tax=Rhodohalobacter sp. TaxID=1974210 RepID=UPI002ACD830C|nr:GAF domain-containing sensor histidine kinase [Rhodohalobacter sp.]MDZ7758562.1 GAF domain-containing sensor histidine kinase [Rhodohalobacter sp.]
MAVSKTVDESEQKRIEALHAYSVLDTAPEEKFDDLTTLAADLCDAPIARINLIDTSRQWAKSIHGMSEETREVPRNITVCQYTIQKNEVLEIKNLTEDSRFKDFSYVKEHPNLRYYLGAPLLDPDGYAIGALCVLDYKEREMPEKQKKQLQILAGEVMARLELRKQNHKLKELNEHKLKLMKMLSHDMRSPLNGIIGMSNMLSELVEGDEEAEMIELMEQSAMQLNHMIDEILSYSLMESKGFTLNSTEVDLKAVTESMKRLYQPVAKSKSVDLNISLDADEMVCIDKDKFEQIYGNLLSNAIKFTRSGGQVRGEIELRDGEIKLKVEDSGVGMDEDTASDLFQNGTSASTGGTSGEKSTGLGLAIVKYFVDLHNGVIDVSSEKDKGTTFLITIPLTEDCK